MLEAVLASGEIVNELIFPPIFFALIALGSFGALAIVVYSYRDVANRHRHKTMGQSEQAHH
ncbi:hypothetical protein OAR17_02395 [Pontimonas sp.]|jgi:hypothetical protein|nr:hypothetical protein [Pontimonas sp.]MDB4606906.1 hypothetical protein [Pontimonas sp.]MDC0991815.1 hypothetical protein [Pontimonas sp.]